MICDKCGEVIFTNNYGRVAARDSERQRDIVKCYCLDCYLPTLQKRYPVYAAWKSKIKKKCDTCGKLLLATEEFFNLNRSGEYGLSNTCHSCTHLNSNVNSKINAHVRRVNMAKVTRKFNMRQWFDTVGYFNYSCAYCGDKTKKLCQDHIIPISKLGDHTKNNIVPACQSCNSKKRDHNMEEWYIKQDFFNDDRYNKILTWVSKKNLQDTLLPR